MEPPLASFIHEHGIRYQTRQFRLFTFSRILGAYELSPDKHRIRFSSHSGIIISSPIDRILQSLAKRLLEHPILQVGSVQAAVTDIHAETLPALTDNVVRLRTMSPIVAYNTMQRLDQRKYTLYRDPSDPEFTRLLSENLHHKLAGLSEWAGQPVPKFSDQPLRILSHHSQLRILKYRDIIIKGYDGIFTIVGDPVLLQLGLESGIGSKNSQGFGCVTRLATPATTPKEASFDASGHAPTRVGLS